MRSPALHLLRPALIFDHRQKRLQRRLQPHGGRRQRGAGGAVRQRRREARVAKHAQQQGLGRRRQIRVLARPCRRRSLWSLSLGLSLHARGAHKTLCPPHSHICASSCCACTRAGMRRREAPMRQRARSMPRAAHQAAPFRPPARRPRRPPAAARRAGGAACAARGRPGTCRARAGAGSQPWRWSDTFVPGECSAPS